MPSYTTNYNIPKPNVNSADDEDLWGDQLNDGMDLIDTQMKVNADAVAAFASGAPIGAPIPYFGSSAPSNHLLCYGQTIGNASSGGDLTGAEYEDLFDICKNCAPNTGAESFAGNDTVVIPDLRGYVIAGKDNMGGTSADRLTDQSGGVDGDTLGDTGGDEVHTLSEAEMPSHTHSVDGVGYARNGQDVSPKSLYSIENSTPTTTGSAGSDGAHNNVQPTIILNYIVRYQ